MVKLLTFVLLLILISSVGMRSQEVMSREEAENTLRTINNEHLEGCVKLFQTILSDTDEPFKHPDLSPGAVDAGNSFSSDVQRMIAVRVTEPEFQAAANDANAAIAEQIQKSISSKDVKLCEHAAFLLSDIITDRYMYEFEKSKQLQRCFRLHARTC